MYVDDFWSHFLSRNKTPWCVFTLSVALMRYIVTIGQPCWSGEIFLNKPWKPKVFFQFEIIISVLVSFFRFIWITMLWVYGHYKYLYSHSVGSILDIIICQIMTSKVDPRAVRVNPPEAVWLIFALHIESYKTWGHWRSILIGQLIIHTNLFCLPIPVSPEPLGIFVNFSAWNLKTQSNIVPKFPKIKKTACVCDKMCEWPSTVKLLTLTIKTSRDANFQTIKK